MRRAAAVAFVAAFALAGCGTGGLAESEATGNGEELFKQKCGGCHTMKAAGTNGLNGPNLDWAFAASREEGFEESTIREVTLQQMRYPLPPMPAPDSEPMFPPEEYTDEERDEALEAIANYVAEVAATNVAAPAQGDPKSLFISNCGGCHIFLAAGTNGTVGPNLDETQMDLGSIEDQIRNGGGGMPPFEGRLTDAQIRALAEFVARRRG